MAILLGPRWALQQPPRPQARSANAPGTRPRTEGSDLYSEQVTQRDKRGRIVEREETVLGIGRTYRYAYDSVGRLATVFTDDVETSHYDYDPNGDRIARTSLTVSELGTYDAQDRLLTYGAIAHAYSELGALTSKTDASGVTTYEYDVLGHFEPCS